MISKVSSFVYLTVINIIKYINIHKWILFNNISKMKIILDHLTLHCNKFTTVTSSNNLKNRNQNAKKFFKFTTTVLVKIYKITKPSLCNFQSSRRNSISIPMVHKSSTRIPRRSMINQRRSTNSHAWDTWNSHVNICCTYIHMHIRTFPLKTLKTLLFLIFSILLYIHFTIQYIIINSTIY